MPKNSIVGLALAGALILGGIVLFLYQSRELAQPMPGGLPAAATGTTLGSRPLFTLADVEGTPRSVAEWDGNALVVNFWATWCAPCRREIPLLNQLQTEYGAAGIQILGVAVDFRDDVVAFLEDVPIEYPVLIGEQDAIDAAEAFGIDFLGLPFTAFTDHAGRLLHLHIGEVHREQAETVFAAVAAIREGTLDVDTARSTLREQLTQAAP